MTLRDLIDAFYGAGPRGRFPPGQSMDLLHSAVTSGEVLLVARDVLPCPQCATPHVDEDEWAKRLHRTHLCLACGHEWRLNRYVFGVAPE